MENLLIIISIEIFILVVLGYLLVLKLNKDKNTKICMDNRLELYKLKYDANEILSQLQLLIQKELDQYILLNIAPKDVYYINSKIENELITYLTNNISNKIPSILLTKMELIYNKNSINEIIARQIYNTVLEYKLDFNLGKEEN